MAEDWRLKVELSAPEQGEQLARSLHRSELERDVHDRLGERIVVSNDGPEVFLYADSEEAAREAQGVVESMSREHGWGARLSLTRWHPEAEEWHPADEPLPASGEQRGVEHSERVADEREDTAEEGYAQWEVRIECRTRAAAHDLSKRLESDGVPHVRRWRYVLVGTTDEDSAREWAERLRAQAGEGTRISVEGTFASVERHNPFAVFSGASGGP